MHHPSNIVSTNRPYRVAGLVDLEDAGWIPEYWECCKARYKSLVVLKLDTTIPGELFVENLDETIEIAWCWSIDNFHEL